MTRKTAYVLLVLGFALMCTPAAGAQKEPAQSPAAEPDSLAVMRQMCDYLKTLKQFSFRSEILDDQVYLGGKKLQYAIDTETFVRRPDRLRVNAVGDLVDKQFFFDGKTITLYDRTEKVYGTIDVPPDIEDALAKAHKDFGLKVALTDLASPQLWEHFSRKVEHALYAGLHRVRGVLCHHLAFDAGDVHMQIWVDAGEKPLPRKVIFLYKKLRGSPQWTAFLSDWKTSPRFEDRQFKFVLPEGVQKIRFVPVQQPPASEKEKGGKS